MTVTVFLNVKTINIFVDLHRLLVYYLPLDYNFIDVCLLVSLSVGRITLIQLGPTSIFTVLTTNNTWVEGDFGDCFVCY